MGNEQEQQSGHSRVFPTRRFLDRAKSPPEYVDEVLPTITLKLQGPERRASARMPSGTIAGSFRITGTNYDLVPGTYSFRATRVSVGIAGDSGAGTSKFTYPWKGTVYNFHIRHSREGTIMTEAFNEPGQRVRQGDGLHPVFSVGPGTLIWQWVKRLPGIGTRVDINQTIEGLLG